MRFVWSAVILLTVTGCATTSAPQPGGRSPFWVPWPEWTPLPLSLIESTENGEALVSKAPGPPRPEPVPAVPATPAPPPAKSNPITAPLKDLETEYAEAGKSVKFAVSADGTPPLSFQWRRKGVPIAGATAAFLEIEKVSVEHAGNYDCIVTNSAGSAASQPFNLVVRSP
jgi:hypothetical protein